MGVLLLVEVAQQCRSLGLDMTGFVTTCLIWTAGLSHEDRDTALFSGVPEGSAACFAKLASTGQAVLGVSLVSSCLRIHQISHTFISIG